MNADKNPGDPCEDPSHVAGCMCRFGSIEDELADLARRLQDLPTTSTLCLILQYLDGIDKRLQTMSPGFVVNEQRTDEALRLAGVAHDRVQALTGRIDALTASMGLMLQRHENIDASLKDLHDLVVAGDQK